DVVLGDRRRPHGAAQSRLGRSDRDRPARQNRPSDQTESRSHPRALARHESRTGERNMKKLIIALTVLLGIALGVGTASAAGAITTGSNKTATPPAGGASGAIVVDWNQQLLQIVLTPGAQPATVHPTRSFAILHAAIYDSIVSITKDDSPYLFSV